MSAPAVALRDAQMTYPGTKKAALHVEEACLPRGARCLLLGANGAGKSSLLRVAAGLTMQPMGAVTVLGKDAFRDVELTSSGKLVYLGEGWAKGVAGAHGDVKAGEMIEAAVQAVGTQVAKDRSQALMDMLQVDPTWRMSTCSDGQRRRVQICLALVKPYEVLLMDEITVDLDVVARKDLLRYFRRESEERGATMIYATHIFDGLETWPTHIAHCADGKVHRFAKIEEFEELKQGRKLLYVVQDWLREDQRKVKASKMQVDAETREKERLERAKEMRRQPHMPMRHLAFFR